MRNNLDMLFKTFFGRGAWSPKMEPVMPGLWSTLFMVVPVNLFDALKKSLQADKSSQR